MVIFKLMNKKKSCIRSGVQDFFADMYNFLNYLWRTADLSASACFLPSACMADR